MNFKCILLLGATASGKTALAHNLSDTLKTQFNISSELVNLDAFQIYKELNIGTAKPSISEIQKYHYHGIDICNIDENLDANSFSQLTWQTCLKIYKQNKIPICVGGSGLYLRAFLHGLDNLPIRDEKIRNHIREIAHEKGWIFCHEWLQNVDPIRAQELHPNDKTRIERALEIFILTGKPQSSVRSKETILKEQNTLFPCYVIHCKRNSEELKSRITQRVNLLFEQGWQEEVLKLIEKYGDNLSQFHSMQAIGYKQILSLNNLNKADLISKISTLTWQYAKKQLTWCAKEKIDFEFYYTHMSEIDILLDKLINFLR
jgi:tRNA dimethylallyltransferase